MKTLGKISGKQIMEKGNLMWNGTGYYQTSELYFVQIDDEHSVDSEGCIFQIWDEDAEDDDFEVDKNEFEEKFGFVPLLIYRGKSGTLYNYAEDKFDGNDIFFDKCKEYAANCGNDSF